MLINLLGVAILTEGFNELDVGKMMAGTKTCGFCGRTLVSDGEAGAKRAREHVLKKAWILKLGHEKTPIQLTRIREDEGQTVLRTLTPMGYLAGAVCGSCNWGWMEELDDSVEEIILGLAAGVYDRALFSSEKGLALSRWILKTAIASELASPESARRIPLDIQVKCMEPDYLPSGFALFIAVTDVPSTLIGTHNDSHWLHRGPTKPNPGHPWFKFAVIYNQVMIGCAYSGAEQPVFLGDPRLHIPILCSGAQFGYEKIELPIMYMTGEEVTNPLHLFLMTIRLT